MSTNDKYKIDKQHGITFLKQENPVPIDYSIVTNCKKCKFIMERVQIYHCDKCRTKIHLDMFHNFGKRRTQKEYKADFAPCPSCRIKTTYSHILLCEKHSALFDHALMGYPIKKDPETGELVRDYDIDDEVFF